MAINTTTIQTTYEFGFDDAALAKAIRGLEVLNEVQTDIKGAKPGAAASADIDQLIKKQQSYLNQLNKVKISNKEYRAQIAELKLGIKDLVTQNEAAGRSYAELEKKVESLVAELERLKKKKNETLTGFQKFASNVVNYVATAFAIDRIAAFVSGLATIDRQIEVLELKLRSSLQGSITATREYLKIIREVDLQSPFDLQQITEGTTKLLNRRILLTKEQLQSLANIGASIGTAGQQSFVQVVEAYLDAMVGQYRRLEELGVGVNAQGKQLLFTFGGVTTAVDKNTESVANYILNLDKLNNSQAIAAQLAETTEGQISLLDSAYQNLAQTIGEAGGRDAQKGFIGRLIILLGDVTNAIKVAQGAYGRFVDFVQGTSDKTPLSPGDIINQRERFIRERAMQNLTKKGVELNNTAGQWTLQSEIQGMRKEIEAGGKLYDDFVIYVNKYEKTVKSVEDVNKRLAPSFVKLVNDAGGVAKLTFDQLQRFQRTAQSIERISRQNGNNALSLDFQKVSGEIAQRADTIRNENRKQAEKDEKEAERAAKRAAARRQQQEGAELDAEKKLTEALIELQRKANRDRLENLDKNSIEYIKAKRAFDLSEIEAERKKYLELENLANGTAYYDALTNRTRIRPAQNKTIQNPDAANYFNQRENTVNRSADFSMFRNDLKESQQAFERFYADQDKLGNALRTENENQVRDIQLKYDELLKIAGEGTAAYTKLVEKRDKELTDALFGKVSVEAEKELNKALIEANLELVRQAGESELAFEFRKQTALLKIQQDFARKQLEALEKAGVDDQDVRVRTLRATVKALGEELDKLGQAEAFRKKDIFEVFGLNVTDAQKQALQESAGLIKSTFNDILQAQISIADQRISDYDRQIQSLDNRIQEELLLAQEGRGNTLEQARLEREGLKAEREKALADKRRDQAIQIGVNSALQASEMALSVAQIIRGATALGPIVGAIVAGVQIAAIIGLLVSSISQIKNLSKPEYEDGGFIDYGQRHRQGGVDINVERGESVLSRQATSDNRPLLKQMMEGKFKYSTLSPEMKRMIESGNLSNYNELKLSREYMVATNGNGSAELYNALGGKLDRNNELLEVMANHAKTLPAGARTSLGNGQVIVETPTETIITDYSNYAKS